jgi:hypothetical protein
MNVQRMTQPDQPDQVRNSSACLPALDRDGMQPGARCNLTDRQVVPLADPTESRAERGIKGGIVDLVHAGLAK